MTPRHHVVRQSCAEDHPVDDEPVCAHRFAWTAELHAHWLANHERQTGVFYAARPITPTTDHE